MSTDVDSGPEMIAQGVRIKMGGHVEDLAGDQAMMILQQRPKDRSILLMYHLKAPHRSWIPAPRFEKYEC